LIDVIVEWRLRQAALTITFRRAASPRVQPDPPVRAIEPLVLLAALAFSTGASFSRLTRGARSHGWV
jgi:hypothetical protein